MVRPVWVDRLIKPRNALATSGVPMNSFWRRYLNPRLVGILGGIWLPRADAIQVEAIPRVLSGVHVLITAPTGSGKTEAAIFPIMSKILSEGLTSGVAVIYIRPRGP